MWVRGTSWRIVRGNDFYSLPAVYAECCTSSLIYVRWFFFLIALHLSNKACKWNSSANDRNSFIPTPQLLLIILNGRKNQRFFSFYFPGLIVRWMAVREITQRPIFFKFFLVKSFNFRDSFEIGFFGRYHCEKWNRRTAVVTLHYRISKTTVGSSPYLHGRRT